MGSVGQIPSAARRLPVVAAGTAWKYGPLLLVLATAVVLRHFISTNIDVSWLLTIGEKMLAGERLYVDLIEVNPPASAFLYLPAIVIARALGPAPEIVVDALVFLAAGCSIWISGRILIRARLMDDAGAWSLAAWSAAVLLVLPMQTFGEREHIATITLLPLLALLAGRARNGVATFPSMVIAGIGAGITIVIKPHFMISLGLAVVVAAHGSKSWRLLFAIENWIAGTLLVAYGIYVVAAYPEFIRDVVPLVQAVYVPARKGLLALATTPPILCWMAALVFLARSKRGALLTPPLSILLAASMGFAAVYFIQGKGWPYHSYPMLALTFIALAVAGVGTQAPQEANAQKSDRLKRVTSMLPVAALAAVSCIWLNVVGHMDALIEPIRRLKAQPSMLIITSEFSAGHPLVRELGGKWVSRVGGLWISAGVFQHMVEEKLDPDTKALLRGYAARDRDMLAEDIERNRPDIILVEKDVFDWDRWARSDPVLVERLKAYREAAIVGTFVILRRKEAE